MLKGVLENRQFTLSHSFLSYYCGELNAEFIEKETSYKTMKTREAKEKMSRPSFCMGHPLCLSKIKKNIKKMYINSCFE